MSGEAAATNFVGHNLRVGCCTKAATACAQLYQIREEGEHKFDLALARYVRPVAKRDIG